NLFRRNRIVTGARNDLRVGPAHFNLHLAKRAVEILVRTAIRECVARLYLLVNAFKSLADVVASFYEPPAGVARKAIKDIGLAAETFLSRIVENSLTADGADAFFLVRRAGDSGERRTRNQRAGRRCAGSQSSGVDDIDGDVCAVREVDRALHLPIQDRRC